MSGPDPSRRGLLLGRVRGPRAYRLRKKIGAVVGQSPDTFGDVGGQKCEARAREALQFLKNYDDAKRLDRPLKGFCCRDLRVRGRPSWQRQRRTTRTRPS